MKQTLFILIAALFVGCDKSDQESQSAGDILTSGPWYLEKRRVVTMDSTNSVISDTTTIITGCIAEKPILMLRDSSAIKNVSCFMPSPETLPGKWSLRNDSSFYMIIILTRCTYGTGCVQNNIGIPESKLVQISSGAFTVKYKLPPWLVYPIGEKITQVEYATYVRK